MKSKSLTEIVKLYFIPLSSFITVLALVPLVILPQLDKISQDSKVINQNKDRLAKIEDKVKLLQNLESNKADLDEKLSTAEKILPVSKAIAPLLLGVQQIAINNALAVNTIKLQPGKVATEAALPAGQETTGATTPSGLLPSLNPSGNEVVFELSLVGNLSSLESFMAVLEKGKRLLLLKQFVVQITTGNTYEVQIFFGAPYSPLPQISQDQLASELPAISAEDDQLLVQIGALLSENVTTTNINPGATGVVDPFR